MKPAIALGTTLVLVLSLSTRLPLVPAPGVAGLRAQGAAPPPPPPPPLQRGQGGPPGRGGRGPGGPGGGGPGRGGRGGLDGFGPMRVPDSNPLTPEKVALGRQLFFDTRLSASGTISCATCHEPGKAFTDGRAVARGVNDAEGARNTPSLVNAGYGRTFFWDGRAETLEAQVMGPILNPKEMGLSEAEVERRLAMKTSDVAAALASYVRTIRSRDSRYDWYVAGQAEVLTEQERTGLQIFRGRGQCAVCHAGPNFTDEQFHNTGVGWRPGPAVTVDPGRFAVTGDARDRGAFKTPTLRDIARTAPYMHDGSLRTLEEVIEFYSEGGRRNPALDPRMRPRDFSPDEKRALLAFLQTLNGHIVEGMER
jgi:cytochrome c peroxidase